MLGGLGALVSAALGLNQGRGKKKLGQTDRADEAGHGSARELAEGIEELQPAATPATAAPMRGSGAQLPASRQPAGCRGTSDSTAPCL